MITLVGVTKKHTDRPCRPCPFCGQFKTRITRHIKAVHKQEEFVKDALKSSSTEQRSKFKQCKRTGIMKYNLTKMGCRDFALQRERAPKALQKDKGVVCDKCNGIFSRAWFYGHRKQCMGDGFGMSHVLVECRALGLWNIQTSIHCAGQMSHFCCCY